MGRRGRGGKWLLDDLKETRGSWKLKEEALHRTVWRTGFGRGYELGCCHYYFLTDRESVI